MSRAMRNVFYYYYCRLSFVINGQLLAEEECQQMNKKKKKMSRRRKILYLACKLLSTLRYNVKPVQFTIYIRNILYPGP